MGHGTKLKPTAAALLGVGLVFAVMTDGQLPFVWSKTLFVVLMALNVVTIHWLVTSDHDRP